jgi:hypothetical protein
MRMLLQVLHPNIILSPSESVYMCNLYLYVLNNCSWLYNIKEAGEIVDTIQWNPS